MLSLSSNTDTFETSLINTLQLEEVVFGIVQPYEPALADNISYSYPVGSIICAIL